MGVLLVITKARDGAESVGSYPYLCAEGAIPESACACEMNGCAGVQPITHHEY